MRRAVGLAAAGALSLAAVAGVSTTSWADSPVTATATVAQATSLTGVNPVVTFPSTVPGGTATVTGAETYTVSTNDNSGYSLSVLADGTCSANRSFCDGAGDKIPLHGDFTITETGAHPGAVDLGGTGAGSTGDIAQTTGMAAGDNYSENWALTIPSGQPAGNYTETFTYAAVGN